MEGAGVKFEADDGEYEDSKHDEKSDLRKWGQGLQYGLENHLQTCDFVVRDNQFLNTKKPYT